MYSSVQYNTELYCTVLHCTAKCASMLSVKSAGQAIDGRELIACRAPVCYT